MNARLLTAATSRLFARLRLSAGPIRVKVAAPVKRYENSLWLRGRFLLRLRRRFLFCLCEWLTLRPRGGFLPQPAGVLQGFPGNPCPA